MTETCGHERTGDAKPCEVDFGLCGECGHCWHHCEHRAEEAHAAKMRGGQATARKLQGQAISPDDLPPLTSHDAAEVWTDRIGRAAATGTMAASAANAALRAVREWREAREDGKTSEQLAALTDALAQWRKTGDPGPVLELVKGGAS